MTDRLDYSVMNFEATPKKFHVAFIGKVTLIHANDSILSNELAACADEL